jgi:hypothetical protein
VAQLCVAALDKGWAIAGEPRLDLSHACSPECINIYGLVSIYNALLTPHNQHLRDEAITTPPLSSALPANQVANK